MTPADLAPIASAEVPIAAYGGWVVWSEPGPDRLYRLVAFHDGVKQDLSAVAPRSVPFDLDVGPGALDRPEVTFSRCRNEPRSLGCRLRTVSLPGGGEAGLPVPADAGASDRWPARWGDRVAFERRAKGARVSQLMLYDLRLRHLRRLGHGAVPAGSASTGQVTGIDLGRETMAYGWWSASYVRGARPQARLLAQNTRGGPQAPDSDVDANADGCETRVPRSPNAIAKGALFLEYVVGCDDEAGGLTTLDLGKPVVATMAPIVNLRRIARDAADGTVYGVMGPDGAPRLVRMDTPPPFVTAL